MPVLCMAMALCHRSGWRYEMLAQLRPSNRVVPLAALADTEKTHSSDRKRVLATAEELRHPPRALPSPLPSRRVRRVNWNCWSILDILQRLNPLELILEPLLALFGTLNLVSLSCLVQLLFRLGNTICLVLRSFKRIFFSL